MMSARSDASRPKARQLKRWRRELESDDPSVTRLAPKVIAALDDDSEQIRRLAADILGSVRTPEARRALWDLYRRPGEDPFVRRMAIFSLAEHGAPAKK